MSAGIAQRLWNRMGVGSCALAKGMMTPRQCLSNKAPSSAKEYDIVVVGSGLVGSAFTANLLKRPLLNQLEVAMVESRQLSDKLPPVNRANVPLEPRVTAITHTAEDFLRDVGVWESTIRQTGHKFENIQIWDKAGPGFLRFYTPEIRSYMGTIVENSVLLRELHMELRKHQSNFHLNDSVIDQTSEDGRRFDIFENTEIAELKVQDNAMSLAPPQLTLASTEKDSGYSGCISGRLVVAADGANSRTRALADIGCFGWQYDQAALVIAVELASPTTTAWQRFLRTGPLAILPSGNNGLHAAVVWSLPINMAKEMELLDKADIINRINGALSEPSTESVIQSLTGAMLSEDFQLPPILLRALGSPQVSPPIALRIANSLRATRVALIGDAARSVHPLAGQGANLGFADAETLVNVIDEYVLLGEDMGGWSMLEEYEQARLKASLPMVAALHTIHQTFQVQDGPFAIARNAVISVLDRSPGIKTAIAQVAMGLENPSEFLNPFSRRS